MTAWQTHLVWRDKDLKEHTLGLPPMSSPPRAGEFITTKDVDLIVISVLWDATRGPAGPMLCMVLCEIRREDVE